MNILNKHKLFVLRIVLLVASFAILLAIIDIETVYKNIKAIPLFIVTILVSITLFRAWLTGIRWSFLNPDLSGQLTKWHYFRYTMIGYTFNLIMPGALGGDFMRTAFTVGTVKKNKAENVIAIIVDRFVGLLSILLLGLFAFMFARDIPSQSAFYFIFAVFVLMIIVVVFITNPAVIAFFENKFNGSGKTSLFIFGIVQTWKNALHYFKTNKQKVLFAFLLCLPIHMVAFISIFILARSLGIDISFFSISLITAIVWLITAIPVTISGAGVRELTMVYLFSLYGVSAEEATALAAFTYIISFFMALIGIVFMIDLDIWVHKIKLILKGGSNVKL